MLAIAIYSSIHLQSLSTIVTVPDEFTRFTRGPEVDREILKVLSKVSTEGLSMIVMLMHTVDPTAAPDWNSSNLPTTVV